MTAPFLDTPARRLAVVAGGTAILIALVYRTVLYWLADDWSLDGNYSHGWLVVPLALYLAWERRDRLSALPLAPSRWGLTLIAAALALLAAGTIAAETFSTRISLVLMIVGVIWFVAGARHVRTLWFPLAFLLLMIPIPMIIFNRVAFPLQLVASEFGGRALALVDIPFFREGNLIELEQTSLNVAEACSGIRSLVSLFTLSIIYGYFTTSSVGTRVVLALSTIPIAIVTNGLRVASTGIAVHYFGSEAAEGVFHESAGMAVFVAAAGCLALVRIAVDFGVRHRAPAARLPLPTGESA
jgi:exosortase